MKSHASIVLSFFLSTRSHKNKQKTIGVLFVPPPPRYRKQGKNSPLDNSGRCDELVTCRGGSGCGGGEGGAGPGSCCKLSLQEEEVVTVVMVTDPHRVSRLHRAGYHTVRGVR
ncbi:hypothetical protein AMECASPLE_010507 [Ameca splendens]|uniref:Uncharacterized protein n=1 Tax=Ameca splendens TaxID=208324 RepID=A0ABV0YBF5_9TELE